MTETTLFKRTLGVLGATIVAPLFVAATGVGNGNVPTKTHVANYINNVATTVKNGSKDAKNSSQSAAQNKTDDTTANTVSGSQSSANKVENAPAKSAGNYTVKSGDTYGCIAENYYGSYDQWPKIYAANGGYAGYEEYGLDVGAKLTLPTVSASEVTAKTNLCN